jgi:elongation factor 1-gamma
MTLTLLAPKDNLRAKKILVAAKYLGVDIETVDFKMGTDNKTKEFLELNPLGKVPVLKTPDGPVFESHAILRYVAQKGKKNLTGKTPYEAAIVDQWMEFASTQIEPPASTWLFPLWGIIPNNPAATSKAKGDILRLLTVLNTHLAPHTFLVGERISLADITVAVNLFYLYTLVLEPGLRKKFTHTNRWFMTVLNQPEFKEFFPELNLCVKAAVPKEPEQKPETKAEPAKEKPKAQPKKEEKEDDGEDEETKEPKAKSLLDSLPKSSMDLDEWKRTYSNNDTRPVALPWLWEHFDSEGYCWFFCEYKYNDELQKVFMTNNLIGGWFQRLDKLRKYGFGSVLIFGEEPKLSISGVWLFRGKEIPEEMKVCDDSELYNWSKLDHTNADEKKKIEDYLAWDGFSSGHFSGQGKIFK